jgi:predicted ATP-grasp superfamily ATP-dependent carboligase
MLIDGKESTRADYMLDKLVREKERKGKKWLNSRKSMRFAGNRKFMCQLHRGESKFPKTCEMTIFERSKKNREYSRDYIKRMDSIKGGHLWEWRWVDAKEVHKQRMSEVYGRN